jgi:hypothetical protein
MESMRMFEWIGSWELGVRSWELGVRSWELGVSGLSAIQKKLRKFKNEKEN